MQYYVYLYYLFRVVFHVWCMYFSLVFFFHSWGTCYNSSRNVDLICFLFIHYLSSFGVPHACSFHSIHLVLSFFFCSANSSSSTIYRSPIILLGCAAKHSLLESNRQSEHPELVRPPSHRHHRHHHLLLLLLPTHHRP